MNVYLLIVHALIENSICRCSGIFRRQLRQMRRMSEKVRTFRFSKVVSC